MPIQSFIISVLGYLQHISAALLLSSLIKFCLYITRLMFPEHNFDYDSPTTQKYSTPYVLKFKS